MQFEYAPDPMEILIARENRQAEEVAVWQLHKILHKERQRCSQGHSETCPINIHATGRLNVKGVNARAGSCCNGSCMCD